MTLVVPSVHAQSPCGWTEQWRTPSDPHSAPPEGRTPSAGVDGTSHWTGSLKVKGKKSMEKNTKPNWYLLTSIFQGGFFGVNHLSTITSNTWT